MKVLLAGPRGFCAGVERAIDIVELALEVFGAPLYVRHEIVHNVVVVERLRAKGAIFTDDLGDVPEGANLIFSAHGVSPAVREEAKARALHVIDGTCPLVTKIHLEVQKFLRRGYGVFYIGHHGHVETQGTLGHAPDRLMLVCQESEVAALPEPPEEKLIYLTQTTLSMDETAGIVAALRSRFPRLEDPPGSDICYATQNRQDAVKALARVADTILVVGSKASSNSNSLVRVARGEGAKSWLLDGPEELSAAWLDGARVVGVTAGASAPEDIVQAVVARVRALGGGEASVPLEDFIVREEQMEFKLPPGLVSLAPGGGYRASRQSASA
jgi:4-hydroxy-3-methylbut-2-enyl diphosphate reductase